MNKSTDVMPLASRTAVVVGGGLDGMVTALTLAQSGMNVRLIESDADRQAPLPQGWYLLSESDHLSYTRLGVLLPGFVSTKGRHRYYGSPSEPYERENLRAVGQGIYASDLVRAARRAVRRTSRIDLRQTPRVQKVLPSSTSPSVVLQSGEVVAGNLVVVADGLDSPVLRATAVPEPTYGGYVAWRGQLPLDAVPVDRRSQVGSIYEVWNARGLRFEVLPIRTASYGRQDSTNVMWRLAVREPEESLSALLAEGAVAKGSSHLNLAESTIEHIREVARTALPSVLADIVTSEQNVYFADVARAAASLDYPEQKQDGVAVLGAAEWQVPTTHLEHEISTLSRVSTLSSELQGAVLRGDIASVPTEHNVALALTRYRRTTRELLEQRTIEAQARDMAWTSELAGNPPSEAESLFTVLHRWDQTRSDTRPLPSNGIDVITVGGSVSGLTTALALAQHGFNVKVVERNPGRGAPRGGALMIRPEGRDIYEDLGVQLESGVRIVRRTQYQNGFLQNRSAPDSESVTWSGLVRSLRSSLEQLDNVKFLAGREVASVLPSDTNPGVRYADGTTDFAQLVVVADGSESTAMQQLVGAPGPQYAGYVAWRGQVPFDQIDPKDQAQFQDAIFEDLALGRCFVAFPVLSLDPKTGAQVHELSWSLLCVEDEQLLPRLLGKYHGSALVPPGQMAPHAVAHVRDQALQLPAELAAVVSNPHNLYFARVVKDLPGDAHPQTMTFAGGAAVGDAVVSPRPFTARSTSKAAEDAWSLATTLNESLSLGREAGVPDHYVLMLGLQQYEEDRLRSVVHELDLTRVIDERIGLCSPDLYKPVDASFDDGDFDEGPDWDEDDDLLEAEESISDFRDTGRASTNQAALGF